MLGWTPGPVARPLPLASTYQDSHMTPEPTSESDLPSPAGEHEPTPVAVSGEDDDEVIIEDDDPAEEIVPEAVVVAPRPTPRPSPPRPWGGNRGNVSPEDLSPEELTPEMRWPPGTWVKVNDIVRHSTGEPIVSISVGDIGQVTAALSQTLVVLFPTRDNRREVIHIDSIETVDPPTGGGR